MTSTEHLDLREINACLFDIFGSVLDWHSTVTRSHPVEVWGESDREELTIIWDKLNAYQDTIPDLTELKRHVNVSASLLYLTETLIYFLIW